MNRLAALVLLPLAATASARAPAQDPDMIPTDIANVEATLLTLGETGKRLTVPVGVGDKGPYNFVIDTGAERTVVARELAESLKLARGSRVAMTAMTGTSTVDTVVVPDLSIKSIGEQHTILAPALEARNLGAVGLLGIDTLQKHQVSIDFERGIMAVRPSVKLKPAGRHDPNEIVIRAKNLFGQLIVTDAYYGNTRIQVVLDTGSQLTIGNSALRRIVGRSAPKPRPIELVSVTGDRAQVDYTMVPDIKVGGVQFNAMPIAFADLAPFERFNLVKRPALMLGMDALRSFRRVDIDFPNRQVRFLLPKGSVAPHYSTGSRIPDNYALSRSRD
jgi:predicted aspartyl protease